MSSSLRAIGLRLFYCQFRFLTIDIAQLLFILGWRSFETIPCEGPAFEPEPATQLDQNGMTMDRSPSASVGRLGSRGYDLHVGERKFGESSVDFLLGAHIDSEWIVRKTRMKFNLEVIQNLKKAIYGIGQGARRWFSGGEISERQASMILDYAVLVELLLECRDDLQEFLED